MAQNVMKGDLALLLAEREVTYGTDPTPDPAANALYVCDWKVKLVRDFVPLRRWGPVHQARGMMPGMGWIEYMFKFPLIGAPDPGGGNLAEPDFSPLLQSGMLKLTSSGTPTSSHAYAPDSTAAQLGCTFYAYLFKDGHGTVQLLKITGGVHNTKFEYEAGKPVYVTFEGMGLYSVPTNPSVPTAPTYVDGSDAMPAVGATFTIGGASYVVKKFDLDLKYTVERRDSIGTGTEGVAGFYLTRAPDAFPGGTLDMELVDEATDARWAAVNAATGGALVLNTGSMFGSQWALAAPDLQFLSPENEIGNGIARYKQPYCLRQATDAGNDEFSMTLTRP